VDGILSFLENNMFVCLLLLFFKIKPGMPGVFMDQVIMPSNVMPFLALLFLFFYFLNKIIFK